MCYLEGNSWFCDSVDSLPFHITDLIFHLGHSVMFSAKAFVSSSNTKTKPYLKHVAMGFGDTAASIPHHPRQDRRESRDVLQWCSEANPPILPHCHVWFASQGSLQKMCSSVNGASPKCYITWAGEEAVRICPAILYFFSPHCPLFF